MITDKQRCGPMTNLDKGEFSHTKSHVLTFVYICLRFRYYDWSCGITLLKVNNSSVRSLDHMQTLHSSFSCSTAYYRQSSGGT